MRIRTSLAAAMVAAMTATSAAPVSAVAMPRFQAAEVSAKADVVEVRHRGDRRHFRRGDGRRHYYHRRHRNRHDGWGHLGAGIAGFIIGNAIANAPYYRAPTYRVPVTNAHIRWCDRRYRSYRVWDNTFQPYHGPRKQCISPYL